MSETKNEPAFPVTIECPACNGYGEIREMVCYGGMPIEKKEICLDCEGSGIADAMLSAREEVNHE